MNARYCIFGKRVNTTIVALDWAPYEDVMLNNTQKKSYANKDKSGHTKTVVSPSTSFQQANPRVIKGTQSQGVSCKF